MYVTDLRQQLLLLLHSTYVIMAPQLGWGKVSLDFKHICNCHPKGMLGHLALFL